MAQQTYMGKPITLNKNHNNAKIKVNILSDEQMKDIGFYDCKDHWYFSKFLSIKDISFNVMIDKKTKDFRIDVLDELFCQPFDYQYLLESNKGKRETCLKVQKEVEQWMQYLKDAKVIENHEYGEYI